MRGDSGARPDGSRSTSIPLTTRRTGNKQQSGIFSGHYDSWCRLPVVGTLQFNDESEKYVFTIVLRPGNAPAAEEAMGILRRIVLHLPSNHGWIRPWQRIALAAGAAPG